jgi:hypothetical protein
MSVIDEIDRQLHAHGCHYDADFEAFMDGQRVIDTDELAKLLPGVTLDELASYQDDKYDRRATA